MSIATSLKLPAELKAQIDETARKAGMTAHAFMVKAISDTARRAHQREQFDMDTQEALAEVESTGLAYRSEDLLAYYEARSRGENPTKPDLKPWRGVARSVAAKA